LTFGRRPERTGQGTKTPAQLFVPFSLFPAHLFSFKKAAQKYPFLFSTDSQLSSVERKKPGAGTGL
jgi:hypothetical protein